MQDQMESRGPLPVEDAADLLLVLLYAPGKTGQFGEPIKGTTRLQKLFFLLRQGEGPRQLVKEAEAFDFAPYKMGPFSIDLRDTVEELAAAGIVQRERLEYLLPDDSDQQEGGGPPTDSDDSDESAQKVTSYGYSLSTTLGMQIGADLWSGLNEGLRSDIAEFKQFFNSLSLRQLLIFTYEKFPDYTVRSTIKDQLGF